MGTLCVHRGAGDRHCRGLDVREQAQYCVGEKEMCEEGREPTDKHTPIKFPKLFKVTARVEINFCGLRDGWQSPRMPQCCTLPWWTYTEPQAKR